MTSAEFVVLPESEKLKMKGGRRNYIAGNKWLKMAVGAGVLVCLIMLYRLWVAEPSIVPDIGGRGSYQPDDEEQRLRQGSKPDQVQQQQRVRLQVYMESQCPDTTYFLEDQLWPVYQQLKQYISLEIIPFGKASWQLHGDEYVFECQHGPRECDENQLQCCGLSRLTDPDQYLPYILCLQGKDPKQARMCSEKAALKHEEMLKCANGPEGRKLHYEAGVKTKALRPRMTFVPWVVINGLRHREAHQDLKRYLCKAFSKAAKPPPCH